MSAIKVTKENIGAFISSDKTVLLDFWAPWCAPCRMISPVIDQIADEASDIKVGKVNIDEEQLLAAEFGVMSIPTLIVVKNGKAVRKTVGVMPKHKILEMVG